MQTVKSAEPATTKSDKTSGKNQVNKDINLNPAEVNPVWRSMATGIGGRAVAASSVDPPPAVQSKSLNSLYIQRMCSECEDEIAQGPTGIQTKLTVGAPNDKYEQQADAVADQVMRLPSGGGELDELQNNTPKIQTRLSTSPLIQRLCTECKDEMKSSGVPSVQKKSNGSATQHSVPHSVKNTINSPGSGSPLNNTVRSRVEPVLGADLSSVRVHSSVAAHDASQSLNAKAFTNQNNIFLGKGQSASDVQLMAHEATHVVQQNGGDNLGLKSDLGPFTAFTSVGAADLQRQLQGDIPGEKPITRLTGFGYEIRIDGDGDQSKELLLYIKEKDDKSRVINLTITQISSGEKRYVNFILPRAEIRANLRPIVKEVTDGGTPTKISLNIGKEWLNIYPPTYNDTGVSYFVTAAGQHFSFGFPPEKTPSKTIVSADKPTFIGGISSVDTTFGSYNDRFRISVQTMAKTLHPTSPQKAILGISPLSKGKSVGGRGAELVVSSTPNIRVLKSDGISLKLDIDGSEKNILNIFDKVSAVTAISDFYHGGEPIEKSRDHNIRIVGSAFGEKNFRFYIRWGGPIERNVATSTIDKAASSNALAISGLREQVNLGGTFKKEFDAYESAFMAIRKKATDKKIIGQNTFVAWSSLSNAMIKLRPQINANMKDPVNEVDSGLIILAASQANKFYSALSKETSDDFEYVPNYGGGSSTTLYNPYTGETKIITIFKTFKFSGSGAGLASTIIFQKWNEAYSKYQELVAGYDKWIIDRLKKKGEEPEEIQQAELIYKRRSVLGAIEKYKPIRVSAVFHPNEKFKSEGSYVSEIPLALYVYKDDETWYLKNLTNPDKSYHKTVDAAPDETVPPPRLFWELNDPDRFPVGVIHYEIPSQYGGQVRTTDYLTWGKFLSYLGLGLAAIGLTLATFGTGTVAVAGLWALAGSAIVGGTAATIDLIVHVQEGDLDATTAILDISQIIAGLAGASALAAGRIVTVAANAPAGARWAGASARVALFADRLYIPLMVTTASADVVSFATITVKTATQLDEIENGVGSREDKDRAKALLLSQVAILGGLTALSVKGTVPGWTKGRTLVLHPGPEGVPVVSTALTKKSIVIDTNVASAIDKKAKGLELQEGEKALLKRIESLGDVEFRITDTTVKERAVKGVIDPHSGIAVTAERAGKEYQDILKVLTDSKVGKAKGVADREIITDTFFAVTESGVKPTFATHDPGIYNNMARISGYEPAKGLPVVTKFPDGFDVTINGKTIRVLPLPKK